MSGNKQYITKPNIARRYQKTCRTIDRWIENPPDGFPAPVIIGGRKHWDLELIEAYERGLASVVRQPEREAA